MTRSLRGRFGRFAGCAVASSMIALAVGILTSRGAAAATPSVGAAASPATSGTVTLTTASGSITGNLIVGVKPVTGAGTQMCDPSETSFAIVYVATPGDEYGVAGDTVNYTILAPEDGSTVPAGGTLTDFLKTVAPAAFPATGGSPAIDATTDGTFSLGVRCQDESSTRIFQNYWTTITISDGNWKLGGAIPTTAPSTTSGSTTSGTSSSATSSSGTSNSGTSNSSTGSSGTTTSGTTTSGTPAPTRSGTLLISPSTGSLTSGTHTLTAVPAAGAGAQPCGDVQAFALLYFTPVGDEYAPAGQAGVVLKARPLQAAGLDVPLRGTLVDFLASVGGVDFAQSLGADESWLQSLSAGKYSVGVRCQSGTASNPIIYQNYFSTVNVAADGTWAVDGVAATSTPTTAASTTAAATVAVAVLDSSGHRLSDPITVKQGQHLFVSATGFEQTEDVLVTMHAPPLRLATVGAINGGIATQVVIPATVPVGSHVLDFTGASSHRTGSITIAVTTAQVSTATGPTSSRSTGGTPSSVGQSPTSALVSTGSAVQGSTSLPTSSTEQYYTSSTTQSSSVAYVADNANAYGSGHGSTGNGLAYTGFPASNSLDLALLLLGFGAAILAMTAGPRAGPGHRRTPRDPRPRRGAHDGSRYDV